jgi:hypothetical protein
MNFIIGIDDFGKVIERQLNFVDKSLFIKEVMDNSSIEATVITRPRRFGKTLNLSMLHHFLAPEVNQLQTKGMFDNLKIAKAGSAYMDQQGKYPVIFISLKSVHDSKFTDAYGQLRTLIQKTYREHRYLITSTKLREKEKKLYEAILDREVTDRAVLENSLQELSRLLHLYHGVKPWLLIDEYDTPIQSAYFHGYYDNMIELMRGIFGSVLKGNTDMHRAIITGILRISKESLFSGVNNLKVFSILNQEYAEHFGFTETEVDEALKKANLSNLGEIKNWYNGYHIGDSQIYNPWSIANCIDGKGALRPYWVNTSSNDLIKSSMALASAQVKEKFEQILTGKSIEETITENMVFSDLKTNSDALWSLLLFSGYLTAVKTNLVDGEFHCSLQTPNQEVAALYRSVIREWFNAPLGASEYRAFLENLTTGQLDKFLKKLKQFLKESSSFFDVKGQHPEKFYHGFVLGLIVSLADTHTVQSNKESGDGRYDVMLIPKDTTQLGLILEFKVAEEGDALDETAEQALRQIGECGYETELRQKNIQRILKVGLAFRAKEVAIASMELPQNAEH